MQDVDRDQDMDYTALLPNELLFKVLTFLPKGIHPVAVALTCKRFRCCVEPILWHTIALRSTASIEHLDTLADTFNLRPCLAKLVKILYAHTNDTNADKNRFIAGLPILEHLSSLKELTLNTWMLRGKASLPLTLTSLRLLYPSSQELRFYRKEIPDNGVQIGCLMEIFQLPLLRVLHLEHTAFEKSDLDQYQALIANGLILSHVEDLTWIGWYTAVEILETILRHLPAQQLKRFVHTREYWNGHWGNNYFTAVRLLTDLLNALLLHNGCLESLVLGHPFNHRPDGVGILWEGSSVDLRKFSNLKNLGVPVDLRGSLTSGYLENSIPSNLEVLQIQYMISKPDSHVAEGVETDVDSIINHKWRCFPRLKQLLWCQGDSQSCPGEMQMNLDSYYPKLAHKLKEVGVALQETHPRHIEESPLGQGSLEEYIDPGKYVTGEEFARAYQYERRHYS